MLSALASAFLCYIPFLLLGCSYMIWKVSVSKCFPCSLVNCLSFLASYLRGLLKGLNDTMYVKGLVQCLIYTKQQVVAIIVKGMNEIELLFATEAESDFKFFRNNTACRF